MNNKTYNNKTYNNKIHTSIRLSFDLVSFDTIFKEIISLDTNKTTHSNDVLAKIGKANADFISIFASNAFNEFVISCKFLSVLKLADVTPAHKKIKA